MAPDFPTTHAYIAFAYIRRGDFDTALELLDRMPSKAPGYAAYLGQLYALSGRHDDARAEIVRLIALSSDQYVAAYDIATIHAALGDVDQAVPLAGTCLHGPIATEVGIVVDSITIPDTVSGTETPACRQGIVAILAPLACQIRGARQRRCPGVPDAQFAQAVR
jgi:pentatricopeptide repeat protein